MTYDWLVLLFGLTFIGAACNAPTWWYLTYRACTDNMPFRFFSSRLAMSIINIGVLAGCWLRLSQAAAHPDAPIMPVPMVAGISDGWHFVFWLAPPGISIFYISALLVGEILLLVTSTQSLANIGKKSFGLWVFMTIGSVWAILHGATAI